MTMAKYPDGISSFGAPLVGPHYASMFGNYWFVNNASTGAKKNGKAPETAFLTIAAAVATAVAGDTIYVNGTGTDYDESVTVSEDMISLIGVSPHPKELGWTADTDATCLTITGDGCVVDGFLFRPDGATSGIAIDMSATVVGTYDAENTIIKNNYFQSTGATCAYAIRANGCPDYAKIFNNFFHWCGYGIYAGATPNGSATGWMIIGNSFSNNCTNGIDLPARRCLVVDNYFGEMTIHLDLLGYGGAGTFNSVAGNHFAGDYSTDSDSYVPGTTDTWTGNWAKDTAANDVEAYSGATSIIPDAG